MDPAFSSAIEAARSTRHRCLGMTLQPLTVGHCFVMAEHKLNFPEHVEEATLSDLVLAVLICSQADHKEAQKLLRSRFAEIGCKIWGWFMRKRLLGEECLAFKLYLCEQLARPEDSSNEVGELTAPLCWRLAAMLMGTFGMSFQEALGMPVPIANCLWATEADHQGTIKLRSERELNFRQWVQEQEALRLAKKEGN